MPESTNATIGSTFDAFLEEEGIAERVTEPAMKKIAAATTPSTPGPDIPPESPVSEPSNDPTA